MIKLAGRMYEEIDKDGVSGIAVNAIVREKTLFELFNRFWDKQITIEQFSLQMLDSETLVSLMRALLVIPENVDLPSEVEGWNLASRKAGKEKLVIPFFTRFLRLSDYSEATINVFQESFKKGKVEATQFMERIFGKAMALVKEEDLKKSTDSSEPSSILAVEPGAVSQ